MIDGTANNLKKGKPVEKIMVLETDTVKAVTGTERTDFLVVSVDMTVAQAKEKGERYKDLVSVFDNEFLQSGINYSKYNEVAIAYSLEGTVMYTGTLDKPQKFDPANKLKMSRRLRIKPLAKK